jgi:LDH2 family malate/lactate/ureidoglycolate dehydrogenase
MMVPDAEPEVLHETPVTLVLDAHGAMGAPVSLKAMRSVLEKAEKSGMAMGAVRNSNHFGIAAYYAMMAMEKGMIGMAMTNTAALGVPTFGRTVMFGTNPLAFAAPADEEKGFVLDMSTTVVTRGKLEVYAREGRDLPAGWAVDKRGLTGREPARLLDDMFYRRGGGILPLGGEGETFSGYKGYGLATMVDILCALLSGGQFGPDVADTKEGSGRVCHYFMAFRIDAFRDTAEFKKDMDRMLRSLREMPLAEGQERVYFAGLKEFEAEERSAKEGVPVSDKIYGQLKEIAEETGVPLPETR